MISPILSTVFKILFVSKEPLQTKSDLDSNMLDDVDGEEDQDDSENLVTTATQVANTDSQLA